MANLSYAEFLANKAQLARPTGIDVDPGDVHPVLMPHQRDIVTWAVRGGRRAIFASFGLGKTLIQLETLRLILDTGVLARIGQARELLANSRDLDEVVKEGHPLHEITLFDVLRAIPGEVAA